MRVYEVKDFMWDFVGMVQDLQDKRIRTEMGATGVAIEFRPNPQLLITSHFNLNQRVGWINFNGTNQRTGKWNSWINPDGNNALSPEMWTNVWTNIIDLM